ncbi:chlorophyllase [Sarracenia purpurea var. burkii]
MSNSSSSAALSTATSNVFEVGRFKTLLLNVEPEGCCNTTSPPAGVLLPPKPLLIATPAEAGEFPVLLFLHGYLISNSFYSQLLRHVASHGFIVIAPQLYLVAGFDVTSDIKSAAAITNWFPEGLRRTLPPQVQPNLTKIALSGHSRGGKTAFALALGKVATTSLKFSALIGVDPVDGFDKDKQSPPPVLTHVPQSFDLGMAVLVIGSGLGDVKRNCLYPPCAPAGVNHKDFYNECRGPASYFVAKDYGHVDMLDDETKGIKGIITYCLCKNGKSREPMRSFVGGIMVAFLKAYLESDSRNLLAIRCGQAVVPVELQKIDFLEPETVTKGVSLLYL